MFASLAPDAPVYRKPRAAANAASMHTNDTRSSTPSPEPGTLGVSAPAAGAGAGADKGPGISTHARVAFVNSPASKMMASGDNNAAATATAGGAENALLKSALAAPQQPVQQLGEADVTRRSREGFVHLHLQSEEVFLQNCQVRCSFC